MIHMHDLSYHYSKKVEILKSLNLSFEQGKIYGLLGKNGAGKSTIIKNLTGMLFPTSGTCKVFDAVPGKRTVDFLKDLFYIPEEYYMPNISIDQLISIYGAFYPRFDIRQFEEYLNEFQIEKNRFINQLSLGQKKKVVIGFALSANTRVLIMDEPTNGLDIPSKIIFRNMINSAFNENRIVIISSHQVRDLDELIHDIVIIDNGKVLLSKSRDHIGKHLHFETTQSRIEHPDIIFQERVSQGFAHIRPRTTRTPEYVDIELLFNAVLSECNITNHL